MSSHDLDEVQRICNRIALINHGEIIKQGELSELQSLQGEPTVTVRLTREPDDALIEELVKNKDSGFRDHRGKDLFFSETKNIPDIVSLFAGKPVNVEEVKQQKTSIEELYASIVDEAEEQE
jgi:ABC-2 type transport system ATP-binding protein